MDCTESPVQGGSDGRGMWHVWRSGEAGFLLKEHEGERPFGWPRHRWENDINLNSNGIGVRWLD